MPPKPRRGPSPAEAAVAPAEPPAIAMTHPALLLGALALAALAVGIITFPITDPDIYQHLTVGRAIWLSHAIPHTHLWTWPSYGQPDAMPSWLFRVLIWPVFEAGGVWGLFVWRWGTTLAALALGWATARRLGARGASPLVALLLCVMVYRGRTMVRPETLTLPLAALTLLLFEWRRGGARLRRFGRDLDPAWLFAPIAWIWVNAHISYWLGFFIAGLYALDALAGEGARRGARARLSGLVIATVAAAALCFANPFGWHIVWQPFEYFFFWRNEPIYKVIGELKPVDWVVNWINGLPLLVLAWPLLALRRLAQGRRDLVELGLCGGLTALTLSSQRFMGTLAICAMPFLARDLAELAAGMRGRFRLNGAWPRVAAALALMTLLVTPLLSRASTWFGTGFDLHGYPVGAADYIARHELRGRIYNVFQHGGYLLWRFWPDRGRLPFMDIHQTGTRADRDAMAYSTAQPGYWDQMDGRRDFEIVILARYQQAELVLPDHLDTKPGFALVFVDDAAALYLRRDVPRFAPLIARDEYRMLCGGAKRIGDLQPRVMADTTLQRALRLELDRTIASSHYSSRALYLRGSLAAMEGRLDLAEPDFRAGLVADPLSRRQHEGLGVLAAVAGRPQEAIEQFRAEAANFGWVDGLAMRMGEAYSAMRNYREARRWYQREYKKYPANTAARDSLAALDAAGR